MEITTNKPAVERLRIKNFAGITAAEFEFKRLNILIGPQASGKSVCAKLLFFFKEIVRNLPDAVLLGHDKQQINRKHKETFLKYFPHSAWSHGQFDIEYTNGDFWVRVRRTNSKSSSIEIEYAPYFNHLLDFGRKILADSAADNAQALLARNFNVTGEIRQKVAQDMSSSLANFNYFIPAGRSYFALLQRGMFSILAADIQFDPFFIEFGKLYDIFRSIPFENKSKNIHDMISKLICGNYEEDPQGAVIVTHDGRRVPIEITSSGQQEVLPLAILLPRMGGNLFVEEPEAHLFPDAQREVIRLLSAVANLASVQGTGQYFITTHSPYILTSVNNLMYAGKLMRDYPSRREEVIKAIGGADVIDPNQVSAYLMSDGTARSIIDEQSSLILAAAIDEVSGELAQEFDRLVDIEYEVMAA